MRSRNWEMNWVTGSSGRVFRYSIRSLTVSNRFSTCAVSSDDVWSFDVPYPAGVAAGVPPSPTVKTSTIPSIRCGRPVSGSKTKRTEA